MIETSDALVEAKEKLQKQDEVLDQILSSAISVGVIVEKTKITRKGKKVDVYLTFYQGSLVTLLADSRLLLEPGNVVQIFSDPMGTLSIVEKLEDVFLTNAVIGTVIEVLSEQNSILVEVDGKKKTLYPGKVEDLEPSQEVLVYGETLIIGKFKSLNSQSQNVEPTGVSWDDIGGLTKAKEQLIEAIENPIKFKELYRAYNQKPSKGALLFGPPGNGKTMLGKAIATSLAKMYNSSTPGFFYVKGPELLSKWVGESEASIRHLFKQADEFYRTNHVPAVIFIDEAESILSRRGSGRSSDVDKTIVPTFLIEMDGVQESKTIVILATNRPEMLDSAIVREGRIDNKIRIGNPDRETAKAIIGLNLRGVLVGGSVEGLEDTFLDTLYSDDFPLYNLTLSNHSDIQFGLKNIVSGAMITNIVQSAINNAIKRDIKSGLKEPSGVNKSDMKLAIINLYNSHRDLYHNEQLEDFKETLNELTITNIKKA